MANGFPGYANSSGVLHSWLAREYSRKDAAREYAHGYSVERDVQSTATPEPFRCPNCGAELSMSDIDVHEDVTYWDCGVCDGEGAL